MYDQFYGLQGRPFQLTPDPHFYFESATHRKALSYLGYGLAQGEGFIVITGDIGAGKTTLVGHLMATVDPARLTAVKIVSTQVGSDDLLRLAAAGFGIEGNFNKAELLQKIEQYLHAQARKGLRTLLIVDEAQNLPVASLEELRMLSNFQLGGQALLQIFLLGQPEFRDMLLSPELEQLRQRVIATHHLEPMLASELEPYIVHRMKLVGWQGRPSFTPETFLAVFAATDGVPRRINALMTRVLLLGAVDRLDHIDGRVVEAVAADMGLDVDSSEEPVTQVAAEQTSDKDRFPEPRSTDETPQNADAPIAVMDSRESPNDHLLELHQVRQELEELRLAIASTIQLGRQDAELVARLDRIDSRLASAEARGEEQEGALRRVLTLLVDWVETDNGNARVAR